MPDAAYEIVDAPWGPIHVAATPTAVVALSHLVPTEMFVASLERRFAGLQPGRGGRDSRLARAAAQQIDEYLAGRRRTFDLPLELGPRAAWDVEVLAGVAAVPWGEATRRCLARGQARAAPPRGHRPSGGPPLRLSRRLNRTSPVGRVERKARPSTRASALSVRERGRAGRNSGDRGQCLGTGLIG